MGNTVQKVECREIDESDPSLNYTSFSAFFHEKYENKLQDIWPMVESSLEEYGIACALNLAERSVTVSKTITTKGRNYFEKAKRLVELLTTTHVPPQMAIETLNGDQRHILIKIGNQEGGLCSKYGIQKEKFVKQRECLACSLEALAALTCCNLFLMKTHLLQRSYWAERKRCTEVWPFVQRFFRGHGISCTVDTAKRCLTFSTTRRTIDLDIIHKAGDFLQLLARTGIPATKAVEILNGRLQHEVIKTGFQDGGLRTKFEIEKDAVAVGTSAAGLRLFRSVVESCFVNNEDPVTVARRLKLDRKTYQLMNKLEGLCL
ncbi:hypothetical protein M0R45_034850 [Rubus argutus]|uniref:KRR-R motif-containing protein 1 n=1 Tax=Rubus argutus TaxID=59490 RepID=A0AAW1VV13_RUBAR